VADIYQQIWDADQTGNGVRAIKEGDAEDEDAGFVRVVNGPATADLRILNKVVIPERKRRTYDLVTKLFDNYALSESMPETETQGERDEVHDLLQAMVDTAPMQVAREYVETATQSTISSERWYTTLVELWFRRFSQGGDPHLSGFEHVVVGEQEGAKIQGYHFWYKYYLDDGVARAIDGNPFPGLRDDRIEYVRSEASDAQGAFPESVTIGYKWNAPDYDAQAIRPLTKPIGGFFVGCSVEGLLAMGAVRAHVAARAPKEAVINGVRYALKVFRSADDKNIRTFYPVFLGAALAGPDTGPVIDTVPVMAGAIRVLAALVNPVGNDPGRESITIINTAATRTELAGWRLYDKNNNHFEITDLDLQPGRATTIVLPGEHSLQLSNKGGHIRLVDNAGRAVHTVSYSKAQASREGETIVF
jgi:poly(U)-specific endoribonuclease